MKHWRWYLIGVGVITLMWAAGQGTLTVGLLLADAAALLWAADVHVVQDPTWDIDDEIGVITTWTL